MKEIGGYFELETFENKERYGDLIAINTGRNALLYLLKANKIRKLYIPHFLCDSIKELLVDNCYDFDYYQIDSNFLPSFYGVIDKDEYIYIVNYYGQLDKNRILSLKNRFGNIILDNVHAFFQEPIYGIDTIYSCRKFFGVPDGAYVSTNSTSKISMEIDCSRDRMKHLLGRYEDEASKYYNDFNIIEESFGKEKLKYMSRLTHNILRGISYDKVREKRDRNYGYLERKLRESNSLKPINSGGPYAYPYYVKNGTTVRKKLAESKIYVPTLWPNVVNDMPSDSIEFDYASNILPLPCDQRYSIDEMQIIVEKLEKLE